MLAFLRAIAVPLFASIALLSCAGGNAASQLAKAPDYNPRDQTKCGVHKSQARPLVIEWPSADRLELESKARQGLVAVRYVGCEMEVLERCSVPARYKYVGGTRKQDELDITDEDDLYANLPVGAAKLEGKLQRSGKLTVKMDLVGRYEAERTSVRSDELVGDCQGATHFIYGVTLGAFDFYAGGKADVGGGVGVGNLGAGAHSQADRTSITKDGDPDACAKATSSDKAPPEGCGAMIRVEVVPLGEARASTPTCPNGTQWDGSQCVGKRVVTQVTAPARPVDPSRVDSSKARLTLAEARRYMVQLINRDRASMGLAPVELDEGAPTRAGQAHAEDMAQNGYLGHWGTDGSVPEQRNTEAGGADMVLENASCFTDEQQRTLDRDALVDVKNVDQAEGMFFNEVPPNDGHRKNILKPWHKRVGIGVAQPQATPTEIPVPCFSQEFVDPYGTYVAVPASMRVGDTLHVEGAITAPATFAGVGLARVDGPKPVSVAELNRRRSYPVPAPYQMFWPPGFQTPIPVQVGGGRFSVNLPLSDGGRPGMYELSVWASVPGTRDLTMVSLRTIQAR